MKKLMALFLVLISISSFYGCKADIKSENVVYEGEKYYIILPISKDKIWVHNSCIQYLPLLDDELLEKAEETIYKQAAAYTDSHIGCSVSPDASGYLCLDLELIVDIDPPNVRTDSEGMIIDGGCNIDHKHVFFRERIANQAILPKK